MQNNTKISKLPGGSRVVPVAKYKLVEQRRLFSNLTG